MIILYLNFISFGNKNTYLNFDETTEIIQDNNIRSHGLVYDYYTQEWLTNGNFTGGTDPWYSTTEGDLNDVNATSSPGAANYEILGDNGSITLISDPPSSANWTILENPEHPAMPEWPWSSPSPSYGIDAAGCWANHSWREGPKQSPSVHWVRNVSMPVNMSDYIITSAKSSTIVNATVDSNIDVETDSPPQGVEFDYVKFYVKIGKISDLDRTDYFTIASYKTTTLGQDSPSILTLANTFLNEIAEETIIFYLTSVLSEDHQNFTIILGMDIFCEDSRSTDYDYWDMLRIKYFNLSVSYEKKINQFTSVSWNQIGNKIFGDDVDIENATLNFKYKIDQNWTESSPNSEIRIFITNRSYAETIKLSTANTSFQDAKLGGFDVTSLILKDENISVTIQVYLADTFGLDQLINVSIDNVSLKITYSITTVEIETDFELFLDNQDKTLSKSIVVFLGDNVNISFKYTNKSGEFIPNATVKLTGTNGPKSLTENDILEHYNITVDTKFFQIGDNFLTLYTEKNDYTKYYEDISIIINIICSEIETNLDEIYLNQENTTIIAFPYGELLNITAVYKEEITGGYKIQ